VAEPIDEARLDLCEERANETVRRCTHCDAPARWWMVGARGASVWLCDEHNTRPPHATRIEAVELDALDLVAEVRRLAAALDAVTAERDAFRAIIEGRTAPPTFAERVAHMEAHRRNRWMARASTGAVVIGDFDDPPMRAALTTLIPVCWWPLDADGRPCAWPTAAPATDGAT
jgi:hypothetical protein